MEHQSFFGASGDSGPVWLQHLLWFLGHPEVLLVIVALVCVPAGFLLARFSPGLWSNKVALLFFVSGMLLAISGALLGVAIGNGGVDRALHDTYYVVAHVQFVLSISAVFAAFGGFYAVFQRLFGVPYRQVLAILHWLSFTSAIALIKLPQYFWSMRGVTRRYADYSEQATYVQSVSVIGYFATLISALLFVICIGEAIYRRKRNTDIHLAND